MEKKFTSEMVDMLANKLSIGLSPQENEMVLGEFDKIDESISLLETLPNIKEVEPMSWCLDRCADELREDVAEESLPLDDAFANCDKTTDREVEIVRVVA